MNKREKVARAICAEKCAFMGEPPCYTVEGEWPNPNCQEPGCHAEADAAIAALEPVTVQEAWQPIETAPKDGTCVILYGPQNVSAYDKEDRRWGRKLNPPSVYEGYFSAGLWQIGGFGVGLPTHWIPLPAPPAIADTGEDG